MKRIRLDIAYDGREFAGWARQRELRTVQGVLEQMVGNLVGAGVEITCAGRTDAGVHARGQVAHLDVTNWPADLDTWRLNRALPADIRVLAIRAVPGSSMLGFRHFGAGTPIESRIAPPARHHLTEARCCTGASHWIWLQ